MRSSMRAMSAGLAIAAAAACGDSVTGVQLSELVGSWNITVLEFNEIGGTGQVDLIADQGFTARITIADDGAFDLTVTLLGVPATESGTLTITGDEIELLFESDAAQGTIGQSGDNIVIELDSGVEYDFDEDGIDDPATLRIVMVRDLAA